MRPWLSREKWGRVRRAGNPQQGHDHLNTAIAMFREMDMRLWLEQAEWS